MLQAHVEELQEHASEAAQKFDAAEASARTLGGGGVAAVIR